jgi:hypothetical protein
VNFWVSLGIRSTRARSRTSSACPGSAWKSCGPGQRTLQYDIYFNDDESEAIVIERYRDSEGLIEHLAHIGDDLMAAIMTTASVHGETLGEPSAKLRAMMEGTPVRLFTPFLPL